MSFLHSWCFPKEEITPEEPMAPQSLRPSDAKPFPPPRALPFLARAYVLLHTHADISTQTEFSAIAACGVMIYGVILWRLAIRNARSILIDEEEGMVLVDYGDERGAICDREVEFVDVEDGRLVADEEVKDLIVKAVAEIKKWDGEVGPRVEFVLSGAEEMCLESWTLRERFLCL
jgi:hypothetical protein